MTSDNARKAMPPRVEGFPSSKGEYLPALADPVDTFWPDPEHCPRNQNAFQAVYTRKKAPV